MYDSTKVLTGIVVFLILLTSPLWWNLATGSEVTVPDLELPQGKAGCVLPKGEMRATHMSLLNDWRDLVVREDDRDMTTWDGRTVRRSLTGSCLGCHTDKAAFCDRCHDYTAVDPYCWDCHVIPEGGAS